jgi:hypothetical protein
VAVLVIVVVVVVVLACLALAFGGAHAISYLSNKRTGEDHAPDFRERRRIGRGRRRQP